jgi:hypothetical protein
LPEASRNWVAVLPELPKLPLTRPSPYLGLHWFKEQDAELFFGRNRAIWELYRLVTQQPLEPIILVHGQTGVGKSSLLEAGLLPRLKKVCEVRPHRLERGQTLLGQLRAVLGLQPGGGSLGDAWRQQSAGRPLHVILDQAEVALVHDSSRPRQGVKEFVDALAGLFGGAP